MQFNLDYIIHVTNIDSEDGFRTGSRNVIRQQQSFAGLQSPRGSFSIKRITYNDSEYVRDCK